jgi:hypothetical protein
MQARKTIVIAATAASLLALPANSAAPQAGMRSAAEADPAWKPTVSDVLKRLKQCYTEKRKHQTWKFAGGTLIWELMSSGKIKLNHRGEVPLSAMRSAVVGQSAEVAGYSYVLTVRLNRPVNFAATVHGEFSPDFSYDAAEISCALRDREQARQLADAFNRLIALDHAIAADGPGR